MLCNQNPNRSIKMKLVKAILNRHHIELGIHAQNQLLTVILHRHSYKRKLGGKQRIMENTV
jgi:isopentenyldiphosphate isomerase